MRFKAFKLLVATACIMTVATVALAAGPNWTDLSEAQQQKYMTLHDDFIKNTASLRDAMWAKQAELNALMNSESIDADKVTVKANEINKLRAEMRTQRAAFAATVKKELGIDPIANPHRGNMGYGCPGYGPNNGCGYGGQGMMRGKGMGQGMMRGKGMMRGHGPCTNMPMQAPQQAPAQ